MNPNTERDIRIVYGNSLPENIIERFIGHLGDFMDRNNDILYPHTISDRTDKILEWNKTQYFSILHNQREKPVVFAGAIERKNKNVNVPAVRFFDSNPMLNNIPPQFLFNYRKPGWTNVELNNDTIDHLPQIFDSQVQLYIVRYITR